MGGREGRILGLLRRDGMVWHDRGGWTVWYGIVPASRGEISVCVGVAFCQYRKSDYGVGAGLGVG